MSQWYAHHYHRKRRILQLCALISALNVLTILCMYVMPIDPSVTSAVLVLCWAAIFLLPAHMLLSLVPHELGHALAGWISGLSVRCIAIGTFGKTLFRTKLFGCHLILRSVPLDGYVQTAHFSSRFQRTREFVMILGGPLANAMIIVFAIPFLCSLEGGILRGLLTAVVMANGLTLFGTLRPGKMITGSGEIDTDGAALLAVPRLTEWELDQYRLMHFLEESPPDYR